MVRTKASELEARKRTRADTASSSSGSSDCSPSRSPSPDWSRSSSRCSSSSSRTPSPPPSPTPAPRHTANSTADTSQGRCRGRGRARGVGGGRASGGRDRGGARGGGASRGAARAAAAASASASKARLPKFGPEKHGNIYLPDWELGVNSTQADPVVWSRVPKPADMNCQFEPSGPIGNTIVGDPAVASDAFFAVFRDSMETWMRETTRNGMAKDPDFKPVSFQETLKFFAVLLKMCLTDCPRLKDYFRKGSGDSGVDSSFSALFSGRRMFELLNYTHVVNEQEAARLGHSDRQSANYDPIYKVRQFFDALVDDFQRARRPAQQLTVDEILTKFLGKFRYRIHIKGKPNNTGILYYGLNSAVDGYLFNCQIYHAQTYRRHAKGRYHATVYSLLEGDGCSTGFNCLGQNHVVTADNLYGQVQLARELFNDKVIWCSTMRPKSTGRTLMPPTLINKKGKAVKSLSRGQAMFMHSGPMTAVVWQDSVACVLLSTLPHIAEEMGTCRRKCAAAGRAIEVPQPAIVHHYCQHKSGTDRFDQLCSSYSRPFKTKKWNFAVFVNLFTFATTNAYIICKDARPSLLAYSFRHELIEQLSALANPAPVSARQRSPRDHRRFQPGLHYPRHHPDIRRECVAHRGERVRTRYSCMECDVGLCVSPCFYRYHELHDYCI